MRERGRHLRRQPPRQGDGRRPGRGRLRQRHADQRPAAGSRPGKAQYTLCCDDATGGVVDDLIAYSTTTTTSARPQRRQHRRGRPPARRPRRPRASRSPTSTREYAVLAVQGTQSDEVLGAVGLPAGHDYMSFVEADSASGCRRRRLPHRLHRRARLRADRAADDVAAPLWDALLRGGRAVRRARRAGSAPATPCAPRWATRCTARTSRSTSRPRRPGSAGRSAGRRTRSGAGTALAAEKEAGPTRLLRGLVATGRGIPRAALRRVEDHRRGRSARSPRHLLADPAAGHRAGAARPRDRRRRDGVVDVRGRALDATVVKPPFVEVGVREA